MKPSIDARLLRRIVKDVAQSPMAELDWDRIEQRVFEQWEGQGPKSVRKTSLRWPRILYASAGVAAAAGTALALGHIHHAPTSQQQPSAVDAVAAAHHEPQPVPMQQDAWQPANQHTDQQGPRTIVADVTAVDFDHAGWARFRLSPHGRLQVLRMDDRVSMRLLNGKLEADVHREGAPRNEVSEDTEDVVSVLASSLQVAVRGTLFSVEIRDGSVRVQVGRGAVAVTSAVTDLGEHTSPHANTWGSGGSEGWLVRGVSTSVFAVDPVRRLENHPSVDEPFAIDSLLESPRELVANPPKPRLDHDREKRESVRPSSSQEPPVPNAPLLPEVLTVELAASTLETVAQGVLACYRLAVPSQINGVTIQAQTTIVMRIAPDGHVVFARFDPPLSPKAQVCASGIVQEASFPRAKAESVLELPLHW